MSPRRRELLALLGVEFEVRPTDVEEEALPGESPMEMVVRLSVAKAARLAECAVDGLVLGSDTSVSLIKDGRWRLFGKPRDASEARRMLDSLAGRRHLVHTGFALLDLSTGRVESGWQESTVVLRRLSPEGMEAYLSSGVHADKAGAYAVQDQQFRLVESIEGCAASVMGLPLGPVRAALLKAGLPVADTETVALGCRRLTGIDCCLIEAAFGEGDRLWR